MKDEQPFSPQQQPSQESVPDTSETDIASQPQAYGFEEQENTLDSDVNNDTSSDESATPMFDSEPPTVAPAPPDVSTPDQTLDAAPAPSEASVDPMTTTATPATSNQQSSIDASPATISPKSRKKKLFIIGGIVAGLLLLGGGGAAAYNLWYQNPDKVIGDALVNAMRAKTVSYTGAFDFTTKDTTSAVSKFKIEIDGKNTRLASQLNAKLTVAYDDQQYVISGAALTADNGDIFLKANDVEKQITKLLENSDSSYEDIPSYITDIVEKIDNKWIRISAEDLKEYDDEYGETQKCLTDTLKRIENDQPAVDEVVELYKANKFIVVKEKLAATDGSLGYVIDGDETKAKSFATGLKDTKIVKEIQKCDESLTFDADDMFDESASSDSDSTTRVEVWVDRWSHQFTKLNIEGTSDDSEGTIVVEPRFNQDVTVEAPKDFVALKDLIKDIEDAMKQYQTDLYSSYGLEMEDTSGSDSGVDARVMPSTSMEL